MAKRTGGDGMGLRRLLIAAVVEHGNRKLIGPYTLTIPRRALRTADAGGQLATLEVGGGLLVTFRPPRPEPKAKAKQ
jgi:hypothetical protein